MVDVILASPLILWIVAVLVFNIRNRHREKPQQITQRQEVTTQSIEVEEKTQTKKELGLEIQRTEVRQCGKFPEWTNQLTERELFDRIYASLRGLPKEEAVKIVSGGETIWLSGYRTDRDFSYSEKGRDLFPITVYKN